MYTVASTCPCMVLQSQTFTYLDIEGRSQNQHFNVVNSPGETQSRKEKISQTSFLRHTCRVRQVALHVLLLGTWGHGAVMQSQARVSRSSVPTVTVPGAGPQSVPPFGKHGVSVLLLSHHPIFVLLFSGPVHWLFIQFCDLPAIFNMIHLPPKLELYVQLD